MKRCRSLSSCLLLTVVAALGCGRSQPALVDNPLGPLAVELEHGSYQISGPFTHENVSVFLIHSKKQDQRQFITLDQGLKEGMVTVTEKDQEQISELQIENRSEQPLFLQEGDRIKGGKQDRTIFASLVIPPKSGKMPLPTFCIERGRWQEGSAGKVFDATANAALAPKEVRQAAKIAKDQNQVWEQVRDERENLRRVVTTASFNGTSLNEAVDAPEAKKVSDDLAEALSGILDKHDDAVGVAVAVNGKIEEVNIYPNHQLLGKLYPRLLQSYALQAAARKDKVADAKPLSSTEVAQFMKGDGKEKAKRTDEINPDNRLEVRDGENGYLCATQYQGTVVHRQILSKNLNEAGSGRQSPPLNPPERP
jgi:hypothetical protein